MVEATLVLLDALDVCEETFAGEGVGDAARGVGFGVYGVDDEGPVHHLVAVEEVALRMNFRVACRAFESLSAVSRLRALGRERILDLLE